MHIGLETVALRGEGFTPRVKEGDALKIVLSLMKELKLPFFDKVPMGFPFLCQDKKKGKKGCKR